VIKYIVRRLLAMIPVVLVLVTIIFLLFQLIPGDPAAMMLGPDATPEEVETMRQHLGLDRPAYVQLINWYSGLLRGDLGMSYFLGRPVTQAIAERLEPTLLLTLFSISLAAVVGVIIGVISAVYYGSVLDQTSMAAAVLGISIPDFWLGLNAIMLFGVKLGWLPVSGYTPLAEGVYPCLKSLLMPAVSIGIPNAALIARMTRSSMLEVLSQDYINTARAKGVAYRMVVAKHALKNALIPTLTVIGMTLSLVMGGAIVAETIFNVPGMGRLLVQSVLRRDYMVIQGLILYISLVYLVINLLVDVVYVYIDPRIRYS